MNRINKFLSNTCKKKEKVIHHNNKLHKIHQSEIKIMKKYNTTRCGYDLEFKKMREININEIEKVEYKRIKINKKEKNIEIKENIKEEYLIPKKFHERIKNWKKEIKPNSIEVNILESENINQIFKENDLKNLEENLKKDFITKNKIKKIDLKSLINPFFKIDESIFNKNRFIENKEINLINNHNFNEFNYSFYDLQPVFYKESDKEIIVDEVVLLKNHEYCCNLPEKSLKLNFSEKPNLITYNNHFLAALFKENINIYKFNYNEDIIINNTGLVNNSNNINIDNQYLGFNERVEKYKEDNQFVTKRVLKFVSKKLVYKIEGTYFSAKFVSNKLYLLSNKGDKIIIEKYI